MEGIHGNSAPNFNDFGLHDFINDAHFDQYFDLYRGETAQNDFIPHPPIVNFDHDFTSELMINNNSDNNCFIDYDQNATNHGDLFGFDSGTIGPAMSMSGPNMDYIVDTKGGEEDEDDEEDDSSGTATPNNKNTKKGDRSRTLVSERKRRGRMKEKLYALRALVPNITKMDKASIVADAVLYVQELQKHAKQLKADIASLESSLTQGGEKCLRSSEKQINSQLARNSLPVCKNIIQMNMYQVDERGFYVRLVSNKGEGVAVSLYKAIESFTNFTIQNSNLATQSDKFILTFTMNARELGDNMNLLNLKIWISRSLLNQGFELKLPA